MKTLAVLLAVVAAALGPAACDDKVSDPVIAADSNDPRMAAATAEARRRWPEFVAGFRANKAGRACAVKAAFPTKDGSTEHMWVQVLSIEGDTVTGRLDNEPVHDVGHKLGDTITLDQSQVEDWLLAEGRENMTGAFTLKVLQEIERERGKR